MTNKLGKEQVAHIAELARIGLSDEEKAKFQNDLGAILEYVNKLQNVDTEGVEPTAHISGLENEMREDENGSSHGDPKVIMDMAPETKNGYVKVKQVLRK